MTYWVTLAKPIRYRGADRQAFSVDGETEDEARVNFGKHFAVTDQHAVELINAVQPLPYPGEPRLGFKSGDCPSFCMHPYKCAGRTSCPRSSACSE